MKHPEQDFTVGDIFSLRTGLALYGDQSFQRSKRLGEFRTGMKLDLEVQPDSESDDFMTLLGWQLSVLKADNNQMYTQMLAQYPVALLLDAIPIVIPDTDLDMMELAESFRAEATRSGVDLEHSIRVTPLSTAETVFANRMYGAEDYQRYCAQVILHKQAHGL